MPLIKTTNKFKQQDNAQALLAIYLLKFLVTLFIDLEIAIFTLLLLFYLELL